tara:strand:- start:33 stop:449 length:417 start_codon:yes stop_codon:yes gene_type:complete
MKKTLLIILPLLLIVGCKTTGVHIIDNPDGTSVKVSFWSGNSTDNQPDILRIGRAGKLMEVAHNASIMTKYDAILQFDIENGKSVSFKCNKSAQKRDYKGELDYDWQGNPSMECLEHKVTKSTVSAIKVGALASFGGI